MPVDADGPPSDPRGASFWSDIVVGVQLTIGGGRSAWLRLTLTAFGVGLCVLVLLLAASVGPAMDSRDARAQAMNPVLVDPSTALAEPGTTESGTTGSGTARPGTFEVHRTEQPYRDLTIFGTDLALVTPGVAGDPLEVPPGLRMFPEPGDLWVSPALVDLLASPEGAGLRPRLEGRVVGTITSQGLLAPDELRFYRGATPSTAPLLWDELADGWGAELQPEPADDYITVLLTAGTTIVIVPLLIFVSLMSRLGAPGRDRRSAAIRLLGASAGQLRRITLTETALAALGGLLLGAIGFLGMRYAGPWLKIGVSGFYPRDITPEPVFLLAVVVLVPLLAVAVVWAGTRQVVVEPLGVVRSGQVGPRRLSWRVAVLVIGAVAMIGSVYAGSLLSDRLQTITLSLAIVALLTSVPILLPWVLERLAARLPTGGTSWLLAVRRLQMDSGLPSRVVAGISVVLAGAIALQTLLAVGTDPRPQQSDSAPAGDTLIVRVQNPTANELRDVVQILDGTYDVVGIGGIALDATVQAPGVSPGDGWFSAVIAPCAAIPVPVDQCRDGDVFEAVSDSGADRFGPTPTVQPGATIGFPRPVGDNITWTVPDLAGTVRPAADSRLSDPALVITPGAVDVDEISQGATLTLPIRPAPGTSGTSADGVRAELADFTWRASVTPAGESLFDSARGTALAATARTGLLLGAALTLLVAAVGLLVMAIEQLHERRRSLTLTVAGGVPRSVIATSLLIGAAIPMVIGVVLAIVVGGALGLFLLEVLGRSGGVDWGVIAGYSAAAIAVVVGVTLATLPAVVRLTRPDALRTS